MIRKLDDAVLAALVLIVLLAAPLSAQSTRIPGNGGFLTDSDFLQNGDSDGINVFYYQIPDTTTGTLYFAVFSPGVGTSGAEATALGWDLWNQVGGTNQTTTFTLIGGSQAFSGSTARAIDYSLASFPGTGGNNAYQGVVLDRKSYTQTPDNSWDYFAGVSPAQGEHIGNQYYFKIVVDANGTQSYAAGGPNINGVTVNATPSQDNNAYQLDVSTQNSGAPTGVSGVRGFAYSWNMQIKNPASPPFQQWDFYPFVPDSALTTDVVQMFDFDADTNQTWQAFNKTGGVLATPFISGNGQWAHSAYTVGSALQTYGTWDLRINGVTGTGGNNAMNIVTVLNSTDTPASGTNTGPPAAGATVLPTFSASYNPPPPDHVTVTPAALTAATGTATARLSIQIVDAGGNPVPAARSVFVQGTPTGATTPIINSAGTSAVVTTDSSGSAFFTVGDVSADIVNISLTTNGSSGSSTLPNTVANGSAAATFVANPAPTMSSASNTTVVVNSAAALPAITIADSGLADITTVTGIKIRIPAGLTANFNMTLTTPTLNVAGGAGAVSGTVTYPDSTTVNITVTTNFAATTTLTISGLALTNVNGASSGNLQMSFDGATYPVTDDKLITISNPLPSLSSASSTAVTAGVAAGLPVITIADSGLADIKTGTGIKIQIPAGLNAHFDTSVTAPTLIVAGGAGAVSGTVTYPDSTTVNITVTTDFAVTTTLTITGLALTNVNGASSGSLQLSFDGATYPVSDDKTITVNNPGFTWTGNTSTAWSDGTNWTSGLPSSGADIYIPNTSAGSNRYPDLSTPAAASPTVGNITIATGASLTINGRALTVNSTMSVSGTVINTGTGTVTASGDVSFNGGSYTKGTGVFTFSGGKTQKLTSNGSNLGPAALATASTYLLLQDSASFDSLTIPVNTTADLNGKNLTVTTGAATLTDNGTLKVQGNETVSVTVFAAGTGLVNYYGGATYATLAAGNSYNNLTFSGAGSWSATATVTVGGSLALSSGTFKGAGQTVNVAGNITQTGGVFTFTTGTLNLNGGIAQGVDLSTSTLQNLTVNNSSGAVPAVMLNGPATLTVGGIFTHTAGTLDLSGHSITVSGTGSLGATIQNSGGAAGFSVTGAVTLTGPVSITTNSGNISFGSTVDSNPAQTLTLTAGAGTVSVAGVVGTSSVSANKLGSFTVVSAATVGLSSVFTTGAQSVTGTAITLNGAATYQNTSATGIGFVGAVALAGGAIGVTTAGGSISFSSTVDSNPARTLTLTAGAGTVSVAGVVGTSSGSGNRLGSFTVVSAATVGLSSVFTTGVQSVTGTAITLNGPTYQSTAGGGSTLGFAGAVTLGGSVTVATANDTVSFSSTVNATAAGVQGLTVAVGTATVSTGGVIGGTNAIGTLALSTGTLGMGGNGLFVAGDITRTSGLITSTGTVTLNGSAAQSVDFTSSTLFSLTVNNSFGTAPQVSATGLSSLPGDLTLTAGTLSIGGTGLSIGGNVSRTGGALSSTGTVTLNSGTAASVGSVTFYNLTINKALGTTVTSTGGWTVTNALTLTQGTWQAGAFIHTIAGNWDSATAGGNFTFTAGTSTIMLSSFTPSIKTKGIGTDPFNNLTVSNDASMLTAVQSLAAVVISAGTLTLSGNNLTVGTSLTGTGGVAATAGEMISVGTDWNIVSFTPAGSTVNFTSNGAIFPGSAATFYTLQKSVGGITTFNENLTIISGLTLSAGTLSDGGAFTITMGNQATSPAIVTWDSLGGGSFSAGSGAVHFNNGQILINGNNTFWNFYVDLAADSILHTVSIFFQEGKVQTVTNGFHVLGTSTLAVNLESAAGFYSPPPPVAVGLTVPGSTPPDYDQQWQINLPATTTIDYARIQLSWANPTAVTPGSNCTDEGYNRNWFFVIPIIASWTLDKDGNGRIDGIRVQVQKNTTLSDAFGAITVQVEGYGTISGAANFTGFGNKDIFDIKLPEGPQEDSGVTPKWQVLSNTSLTVGGAQVDHNTATRVKIYTPGDGARPVITYTAGALGSTKVYVHFSELVYGNNTASAPINNGSLFNPVPGVTTVQPVEMVGNGAHAAIVTLAAPLTVNDILTGPATISAAAIWDVPYPDQFTYPSATSSGDPGAYTNAVDANLPASVFSPPPPPGPPYSGKAMLSAPAHNITDVGLGFVTPVFALNRNVERDPARGGIGMVTNFDGTKWLLPQDVLLEARILPPVPAGYALTLFWDVNPPAAFDFNNLWIPPSPYTTTLGPGGDLAHFPGDSQARGPISAPGATALRDFVIPGTDPAIKDGALLQFMFVISDGAPTPHLLPLAYQADPNNPASIRPFEYTYHALIEQRGQVTITNNVIRPANGESAYLHYLMPKKGMISVTVFTLSGDIVNVLARGTQDAGEYTTAWDGKNRGGRIVARGIYFVRVVGPGFDEIRKVLVVK